MSVVQECLIVTKQLLDLVQRPIDETEREEILDEIERLLEKREDLLPKIQPPFTVEEERMGKQIMAWNRLLDGHLKKIRLQIQADMQEVKKKKTSVQKYVNPYKSLQSDGVFYDRRN
ncbi:flagellar protein FliT [Oikeobacillus pervagus]|uniref:Flagellar protein FliT n=1 Tax=Oikeobacillus pervagus TaxID=1325931 RepID=A0AAJ1T4Y9_9BACI|nr:flagellar protein FliT [Oikeobacillus pervagus]MDQ0214910.1 flagellar protein FliT [Oikeobacillus pervagus]